MPPCFSAWQRVACSWASCLHALASAAPPLCLRGCGTAPAALRAAGGGAVLRVSHAHAPCAPLCRWLFPQLGVATALLLTRTPSICSNPNFRSGYALLARALAAPDTAAGALCRACQPAAVLATFAAVACHLYGTELAQRRAFLARLRAQRARPGAPGVWCPPDGSHTVRGGERARDGPIPAHDGRACMSEFWLSFAVPAIGALLSFVVFPVHLRE